MDILANIFGLCLKQLDKKVTSQNELCLKTCGNMTGTICEKGCMEKYNKPNLALGLLESGMTLSKNIQVDGHRIDTVVINDGTQLTTIFYPLEEKNTKIELTQKQLIEYHLTKSEITIFMRVMQGISNSQICKELFISKATLKTHLNNTYKKLPIDWQFYKSRK